MAKCANTTLEEAFSVRPNADVSGPGVLIAFIATAYLTLILIIAYYVLRCVDDDNLNTLDGSILGWLWRKKPQASYPKVKSAIERIVLTYSDQQLVTGLAILIAGLAQLRSGDTNSYLDVDHWQKMVFTAWFSSLTHLATLSVLCNYFRRRNQMARPVRLILMFFTIVFLITALAPTAASTWLLYPAVPAVCYFSPSGFEASKDLEYDPSFLQSNSMYNIASATISGLILLTSYGTRVVRLFDCSSRFVQTYVVEAPSAWLKRFLRGSNQTEQWSAAWSLISNLVLVYVAIFRALRLIYTSFLWEILWLVYTLLWGTVHLMAGSDGSTGILPLRFDSPYGPGKFPTDWAHFGFDANIDSFGQLLPILLLIAPLFSASELISENTTHPLPLSPQSHSENPQIAPSAPDLPTTNDETLDFHDQNFSTFLWFKLYILAALLASFAVCFSIIIVFSSSIAGSSSSGLRLIQWLPTAVVYSYIYMFPCVMLEKYRGAGRFGNIKAGFKPSTRTRVCMWVWACACFSATIMSSVGWGFIPPYVVTINIP